MTRFVNMTTHDVRVYLGNRPDAMSDTDSSNWLELPYEGRVARVDSSWATSAIGGVHTLHLHIGGIVGIPEPEPGVVYVASSLCARNSFRPDVVCPDIDRRPIWDERGELYAVRGWKQWLRKNE